MPFAVLIGYGPVQLRFFSGFVTGLPNTRNTNLDLLGKGMAAAKDGSIDGEMIAAMDLGGSRAG